MKARQQSTTTYPIYFLLVSSTDHITAVTGITPTVTLSKNGGTFASAAGTVSEISNGLYLLAGNATDRDTLGDLAIHVTGTGCDPFDSLISIVSYDPFAIPSANDNADALLDRTDGVETGLTFRKWLRRTASAVFGKAAGMSGTTATFRDMADSKDRITATVDASGNRSSLTFDDT